MSCAVKEIFMPLQGEGAQAGRAAVFCRFAGCNLWSGREQDRQSSMAELEKMLDHKFLNRIEALGLPSLENLSRFIFERIQHLGRIARVSVHRDSCNESCTYFGPPDERSWRWRQF